MVNVELASALILSNAPDAASLTLSAALATESLAPLMAWSMELGAGGPACSRLATSDPGTSVGASVTLPASVASTKSGSPAKSPTWSLESAKVSAP